MKHYIVTLVCILFSFISIAETSSHHSEKTCSKAQTIQISIRNIGNCPVRLFKNGFFMKIMNPSMSWHGYASEGDLWQATMDGNTKWDMKYNVTDNSNQIISITAPCRVECNSQLTISNESECDISLSKNGEFMKVMSSGMTWYGEVNEGDTYKAISTTNKQSYSTYRANLECTQSFIIKEDCTPPCTPYLTINNNSECDVDLYLNNTLMKTMGPGMWWNGSVNEKDFYEAKRHSNPEWSSSYTVHKGCDQIFDINADCTDLCQSELTILNSSECDIDLYLNDVYMKTMTPEMWWNGGVNRRDEFTAIPTSYVGWRSIYTVNSNCQQRFVIQAECTAPCSEINATSFENGMGIWHDGGHDAYKLRNSNLAMEGDYCIRLRDNSGDNSSIYTDPFNMSNVSSAEVTFHMTSTDLGENETLIVECSSDNGRNFLEYVEFHFSDNFNQEEYQQLSATFSDRLSEKTVFRIRSNTSSNYDIIYLDNISINTCPIINASLKKESWKKSKIESESALNQSPKLDFVLLPNIVERDLNLLIEKGKWTPLQLAIYDVKGNIVLSQKGVSGGNEIIKIDVNHLSAGFYIVSVIDDHGHQSVKKFIKN